MAAPNELEPALQRARAHLTQQPRLAEKTVKAYLIDWTQLETYLTERDIVRVRDLDDRLLRGFIAHLHAGGLDPRTLARKACAIRHLLEVWRRLEIPCPADPAQLKAPKTPRKLPDAPSIETLGRLLDAPLPKTPKLARDRCLFELIYSSGLRVAEVVGLDIDALDLADGVARVTGKRDKTRVVPVGRKAVERIRHWLSVRTEFKPADGEKALFLNRYGRRLSTRSVELALIDLGKRLGLGQSLHPHQLRHAFATHVLESSGDLRAVQEMLGHESLTTTQIYTHLDFQHLARVYESAHPRARRKRPADS